MATTTTTATYPSMVDSRHLAAYGSGSGSIADAAPGYAQEGSSGAYGYNYRDRYSTFGENSNSNNDGARERMGPLRSSSYGEYQAMEKANGAAAFDTVVGPPMGDADPDTPLQSPYEQPQPRPYAPTDDASDRQRRYTPSPFTRDSFRQSKDDSGVFADAPLDVVSSDPAALSNLNMGSGSRQSQLLQNGMPKHPSISASNVPPRHAAPIIPSSAAPSYKPGVIPISSNTRAVAQQPTYITPPSSPTPIAVNPVYTYAPDAAATATARYVQQQQQQQPQPQQPYRPAGFPPQDGRDICVECAMRDQDMADVDVTGPGVWERESDVHYHELCRQELEEAEERARARASNSSSESQQHVVLRPMDPSRPRARGNRLTEPNVKLWLTMNPREPQARQQTIDLYIKTQTALLEAEALARARAQQESRLLESKLKDTYDNLRRTTHDVSAGNAAVDENGMRLKASHGQKRSVSGPTPLSLGPIVVDGGSAHHARHQSQGGREVTLLENGMIVEHVDVRKEERERRREEKRERERERSRARKSSRGSGGERNGEVMSMYSAHSPLPHQTDSGFYTASNGSAAGVGVMQHGRPMSLSQSSTRAMSVLSPSQPLTPPPGSGSRPGSVRPPNMRVHSQISLVDSQSISSASMSANRRSRFFAFRNWSEAWKSRESFAPSGIMSISGSMMDMHLALDREKQAMQMRPPTVDLGSVAPSVRHSQIFPRRASVSVDRDIAPRDFDRPKKKKGLAKIWGMVRGSKSYKNESKRGREVVSVDRSEDDTPLAPPPPLSYLVNRTSRERSMSNASRRTSFPSGTTAPPPTAALPTPTSIRNTWLDDSARTVGGLPAHTEESHSNANGYMNTEMDPSKGMYSGYPEPDMRQDSPPDQRTPTIRTPSSPRPISVYSLHKSLPPLPSEVSASQSMPTPVDSPRPMTMFDMNSQDVNSSPEGLMSPQPYFRRDTRRQSFGGTSSRPDVSTAGTFPLNGRRSGLGGPQDPFGYSPYAEMGAGHVPASRSVGRLGLGSGNAADGAGTVRSENQKQLGKRRSRFGLSSLLGKMTGGSRTSMSVNTNTNTSDGRLSVAASPPPGPATSESDQSVTEYGVGGGGSSRSRHNGYTTQSRMSVASRRAIEELVDQDPKFVAYRYPSVDQNIALLR